MSPRTDPNRTGQGGQPIFFVVVIVIVVAVIAVILLTNTAPTEEPAAPPAIEVTQDPQIDMTAESDMTQMPPMEAEATESSDGG